MLTHFIFHSLSSTSAWANSLCQNTGGSQWCREASLIFLLRLWSICSRSNGAENMPEPPAHSKINMTSPAFLLEGVWAEHPQKLQNCLFFYNFILFLRGNGKRPHLCQLPWNRCWCTVQAGARGSVSHHIPPGLTWIAQPSRQNATILVLYRRRDTTGKQHGSPVFVTAQWALKAPME